MMIIQYDDFINTTQMRNLKFILLQHLKYCCNKISVLGVLHRDCVSSSKAVWIICCGTKELARAISRATFTFERKWTSVKIASHRTGVHMFAVNLTEILDSCLLVVPLERAL